MRNVARLALSIIVAATALAAAPKAHADPIFLLPVSGFAYQDDEGLGRLSLVTDPDAPGPVVPISVTIEQGAVTIAGQGTRTTITASRSSIQFTARQLVGGVFVGPTFVFQGTLFKDAAGAVSGGGIYSLQGAPGIVRQWFVHN
jgi:hypothetical protein